MKAVFIILAIAAAVSAKPSLSTLKKTASVDKWTMIRFYVTETRAIVNFAFGGLENIAFNENPAMGQAVNDYLKPKATEIHAIFDKMDREVNAETLDHEKAKAYFVELNALFRNVKVDLPNIVTDLSEIGKGQIVVTFDYFSKQITAKEYQIYILTLN